MKKLLSEVPSYLAIAFGGVAVLLIGHVLFEVFRARELRHVAGIALLALVFAGSFYYYARGQMVSDDAATTAYRYGFDNIGALIAARDVTVRKSSSVAHILRRYIPNLIEDFVAAVQIIFCLIMLAAVQWVSHVVIGDDNFAIVVLKVLHDILVIGGTVVIVARRMIRIVHGIVVDPQRAVSHRKTKRS